MAKNVAIYTTPTCTYCRSAKELFKENNIAYTEYNVATDMERRNEMIEKSGQMGVPVIFIDNEIVVGYNKPKLAQLLDIK
jgi:glutaredoxin-like YruB-family protein